MAELSTPEVYAPRTIQLWRTLLNWLDFFFQIFAQIVSCTPSMNQMLSCAGLRHRSSLLSPEARELAGFRPIPDAEMPEFSLEASEDGGVHREVESPPPLEKLTVVLDLDDTLVCAYETSNLPSTLRSQAAEAGIKWFELECISSDKECEGKSKIYHVTVFERPGLKEFLKQLSQFADIVLFTAGVEGYASPLVDVIDSEKLFGRRLYRPSTISTEYRDHVKDLGILSRDLCRVVIVDNNPFSFLLQPLNGIPCVPFSPGQPHDEQLLQVVLPLLKHLSIQGDVRPVLYERFHMLEWFQKHGIPSSE